MRPQADVWVGRLGPRSAPGTADPPVSDRVLYLIRHGRPDYTNDEFADTPRGHQYDPPLSDEGLAQSEALARRLLLVEPPTAVLTSPLRRARETALAYTDKEGVEPIEDMELAEAFIGDWENRSFEEIIASDETLLHRFTSEEHT